MMKNSVSDHSFYIDSEEEEENQEKCENGDGNESDDNYSNYSNDNENENEDEHQHSKPNSFNNAWPQSYRYIFSFFLCLIFHQYACMIRSFSGNRYVFCCRKTMMV